MSKLNLNVIDSSWRLIVKNALSTMDSTYLQQLESHHDWLPGAHNIFHAFTLPLAKTRYILFGESPYPRATSANGYAFWDAAVESLWASTGMATAVNRATSLRNIMKMLMVAAGALRINTSQSAIAELDKTAWVQTLEQLFTNLLNSGFLLLNTSLALSERTVAQESSYWYPFIESILSQLTLTSNNIELILLGKVAEKIEEMKIATRFPMLCAEHPYNVSFIQNKVMLSFFAPLGLLKKYG